MALSKKHHTGEGGSSWWTGDFPGQACPEFSKKPLTVLFCSDPNRPPRKISPQRIARPKGSPTLGQTNHQQMIRRRLRYRITLIRIDCATDSVFRH